MTKCLFSLRNKISMSSCETTPHFANTDLRKRWLTLQQSRAQRYVKLFTDFLPLQHYLLIAHRNFVTCYNFARERWCDTFEFDDWVSDLCLGEQRTEKIN